MPAQQFFESTVFVSGSDTARTTLRVESDERIVIEDTDATGASIERHATPADCFAMADLWLAAGRSAQGTYTELG